jgi:protein-S-isoprenylcysteine O-methyltransferase Ste14
MLKTIAILLLALVSPTVMAYIGPGAGISVLGSILGILGTIVVAIAAIIFWPVRKFLKREKQAASEKSATTQE